MRALRVAPACQLALNLGEASGASSWDGLPDVAQTTVLMLLAQMIARSVIAEDATVAAAGGSAGAGHG